MIGYLKIVSCSLIVHVEGINSLFQIRWAIRKKLSYSLLFFIILERFKLFLGIWFLFGIHPTVYISEISFHPFFYLELINEDVIKYLFHKR